MRVFSSTRRRGLGGIAQPAVSSEAARDEQALARTLDDRSHPADTAKCVVVPPLDRVAGLGEQRRQHTGADTGHRQQNGCVGLLGRRVRVLLCSRVGAVRRSSLGKLVHQPVELLSRMVELTVDQSEAFGDHADMRSGGFGCARRQLQGRRPEPFAKRRGVGPADAVLLQHPGQRHFANPLARARRRQAPPPV